jgi:hypothetical protein
MRGLRWAEAEAIRDLAVAGWRGVAPQFDNDAELVERIAAVLSICSCIPGPGYEGPGEDCPRHGKPELQARAVVAVVEATMTTLTDQDGAHWAVYPLAWCPRCGRETPHAGPYCQVCSAPVDGNPA